jgi:hypothetical protein
MSYGRMGSRRKIQRQVGTAGAPEADVAEDELEQQGYTDKLPELARGVS